MESLSGNSHDFVDSPIGTMLIVSDGHSIVRCIFEEPIPGIAPSPDALTQACILQLQEYFAGIRKTFDLPLASGGTDFQSAIWDMLIEIPYGTTCSYAELAKKAGNPESARAVGHAAGQNRLLILIPCHRVLSSDGKLTGFAGGKERKRWLLQHELLHSSSNERLF